MANKTAHALLAVLFSAVIGGATSATAAIPVRWTTDTYKVKPLVYECYHGETLDLASALTSYGEPLDLYGKTARLYWQTNGMDSAWWSTNAAVRAESGSTNILAATFSGAFDTGASETVGFIGVEGENYRAAFTLRFRSSPGFTPSTIPTPTKTINWATVINENVEAAPFVVKGGEGGVTPSQAASIAGRVTSNVVTKAYVESLGISVGADTNAVNDLIRSYDETNLTARINNARPPDYTTTNAVRDIVKQTKSVDVGLSDWICTDGVYRKFYFVTTMWRTYKSGTPSVGDFRFSGNLATTNATLRAYNGYGGWTNTTIRAYREHRRVVVNANDLVTFTSPLIATAENITNAAINAAKEYADTKNPIFQVDRLPTASFSIPSNRVYQVVRANAYNQGMFYRICEVENSVLTVTNDLIYGGIAYFEAVPTMKVQTYPLYSNRLLSEPAYFTGAFEEPRDYPIVIEYFGDESPFKLKETEGGTHQINAPRSTIFTTIWIEAGWESLKTMDTTYMENTLNKIRSKWREMDKSVVLYPSTKAVSEYVGAATNGMVKAEGILNGNIYLGDEFSFIGSQGIILNGKSIDLYYGTLQVSGVSYISLGGMTLDNYLFGNFASKSTTLSGYGITDAKIEDGTITLGDNTITPITTPQVQANWTESNTTSKAYIRNKPEIPAPYVPSATDPTFSNATVAVVNDMANRSVTAAVDAAMTDILGDNWKTTYGGGLAGLIAAIVAALTWLKTHKQNTLTAGTGIAISSDSISTDAVRSFSEVGTQTPTVSGGVADLSTLFSSANTSLGSTIDAKLPYRKVTDSATDRAVYLYTVESASPTISIPAVGSGITDFEVWLDATNYATDYEATFTGATILYKDGSALTFEKSAVTVVHFTACNGVAYTAASAVFKAIV